MIYFKCVKVKLKLYLFIRASHRRQELSWTPHLLALIPSIVPMPLIKPIFHKIFILWSGGANVDTMWALQRSTGEADGDICRCDLSAARCESGRQGHGQGRVLQTRCKPQQTAAITRSLTKWGNKMRSGTRRKIILFNKRYWHCQNYSIFSVKNFFTLIYKYTELLLRETSFISETLTESSVCCKLVLLFSSFVSATSAILM